MRRYRPVWTVAGVFLPLLLRLFHCSFQNVTSSMVLTGFGEWSGLLDIAGGLPKETAF